MSENTLTRLRELGWQLEVDPELGELYLLHLETEAMFVFDQAGNLTIPGDGDIGGSIVELQTLLESALEDAEEPSDLCNIDCEEPVTIESDTRISLDAPTIELDADTGVSVTATEIDLSSDGLFSANSSGVLELQGALLKLN